MRFMMSVVLALALPLACSSGSSAPPGGSGDDGGGHRGSAGSGGNVPAGKGSGGAGDKAHDDGHNDAGLTGPHHDGSAEQPEVDKLATTACAALSAGGSPDVKVLTLDAASSGQETEVVEASIRVDGRTVYRIRLPEGKAGWVSLVQEHWDAMVGFFAPKGVVYEVINADMKPQSKAPLPNAACPEQNLTDYRIKFNHWSLAKIRFSENGPREVMFMVIKHPGV